MLRALTLCRCVVGEMRQVCELAGMDPELVSEEVCRQRLGHGKPSALNPKVRGDHKEAFQKPLSAGLLRRIVEW